MSLSEFNGWQAYLAVLEEKKKRGRNKGS